jgi:hypothetical protein
LLLVGLWLLRVTRLLRRRVALHWGRSARRRRPARRICRASRCVRRRRGARNAARAIPNASPGLLRLHLLRDGTRAVAMGLGGID